jgi:hypothetical protein
MLTCILRILLLFVIVLQGFGCKSYQIERGHHISVDEEGRARGHVTNKIQTVSTDTGDFTLPLFASSKQEHLTDEEFQTEYVDPILYKIERYVIEQHDKNQKQDLASQQPAQILLFIHGGLNSYEGGLEHIQKLLETQDPKFAAKFQNLSSHFILSLNWEAGLRSALIDHFFHIRFGERSTPFAVSTFPIVLLHDLGESIVKSPDAIYSEAKDLFQNQSADFTSAMLTTASMASVYGLPIAALHPTLTIAGVMPYATYASAGLYGSPYFWDDWTRYLFGPIRMASAPLVEGFGTPAWDMLKRRPDLLLFNPTTQKDGATQQLLTQLAGKIEAGRWRTKRCVATKRLDDCPAVELTLLGHSMGAIVSDRILTTLSEKLTFKHIIYVGAANSIADFKLSVVPYLRNHKQTKFWSFALAEVDERNEEYALDLLTRGSLLVWIDLLLERTYGLPQKRFGREVNQEWVNIDHEDAWKRICRISFSGNRLRKEEPRKHGDFTDADNVELVLQMVNNGCPKPVQIVKDRDDARTDDEFRKELKKALERVPRFTPKSIAAIADNAPYLDQGNLDHGEFLSEQSYQEISNYFAPININAATIDELAVLLRGDRYLARQIFQRACRKPYSDFKELRAEIQHLSDEAYELTKQYGTIGKQRPTDSLACIPQEWWPYFLNRAQHWWSEVHPLDPYYKLSEIYEKIRAANSRYKDNVMSAIKEAAPSIVLIEKARTWYMFHQNTPWDATLDIEGQRVAIEIHTWAQLEDKYNLEDQDRSRAQKLTDTIIEQVAKSDVDVVIFVTNEDVFSKPSMAKAKEAIQKASGEKFHNVHGLPKTIPDKIKSVLRRYTKARVS